jgi:hypothetical protein
MITFFVWGYSIGGPVFIRNCNTQKTKLFFFWCRSTPSKPGIKSGTTTCDCGVRAGDYSGYRWKRREDCAHDNNQESVPARCIGPVAQIRRREAGQAILNALPAEHLRPAGRYRIRAASDAQFASQQPQRNYYWATRRIRAATIPSGGLQPHLRLNTWVHPERL